MTIAEKRHNKVASGGNQRPLGLVDVVEAVTAAAVGRRRGDSGSVCAEVIPMHSRAHPARAPRLKAPTELGTAGRRSWRQVVRQAADEGLTVILRPCHAV
jgi:hypothetical protein